MVWTMNKESMQTKSWLLDPGAGVEGRFAGGEGYICVKLSWTVCDVLTLVHRWETTDGGMCRDP